MAKIIAQDVSIDFPLYEVKGRSLRHQLARIGVGGKISGETAGHISVRAVDRINLRIEDGERVGLVGHNGAGKTTLLRTLAEIYEPTSGELWLKGRTVPLFDITLGMDPDATGYENIRLRGLFLGLNKHEIQMRLDDIVAFSDLGDFLSMPVRTYSSGMMVRLAFAVSTSFAPDILLLDEMIGAGDATFIRKAEARLHNFISSASVMFLASHSNDTIRKFCNRALLMDHGRAVAYGPVEEILAQYDRANLARAAADERQIPEAAG